MYRTWSSIVFCILLISLQKHDFKNYFNFSFSHKVNVFHPEMIWTLRLNDTYISELYGFQRDPYYWSRFNCGDCLRDTTPKIMIIKNYIHMVGYLCISTARTVSVKPDAMTITKLIKAFFKKIMWLIDQPKVNNLFVLTEFSFDPNLITVIAAAN